MTTPAAVRSFEYWAFQYKRTWRGSLASSFLNPVLFLVAIKEALEFPGRVLLDL